MDLANCSSPNRSSTWSNRRIETLCAVLGTFGFSIEDIFADRDGSEGVGVELRVPKGELGRSPFANEAAAETAAEAEKDLVSGTELAGGWADPADDREAILAAADPVAISSFEVPSGTIVVAIDSI